MVTVAVAGASGYVGGELLRLLATHPQVTLGVVTAHTHAGARLGDIQPHLYGLTDQLLEETTPENLAGHDVIVLALPHDTAGELATRLSPEALVIDTSAAHRLTDSAAWRLYYTAAHPGFWPYGLPELPLAGGGRQRTQLRDTRRIAVPGCFPTAALLGLAPGYIHHHLASDGVVIVAATGTSGAGKSSAPHLLASEVTGSVQPYSPAGTHRHIPEIEQELHRTAGQEVTISFTPLLAPMSRGILATLRAPLVAEVDEPTLRSTWEEAYEDEEFVHLLPEGQWPASGSVLGGNHVAIQVGIDRHNGTFIGCVAVDNLTKGTAGAALQCMNIALGFPEHLGLEMKPVAP